MTTYLTRFSVKLDQSRSSPTQAQNPQDPMTLNLLDTTNHWSGIDLKERILSTALKKTKAITAQPLVSITPSSEKKNTAHFRPKNSQKKTSWAIDMQLRTAIEHHQHVATAILKDCDPINLNRENPNSFLYHPHRISCHAVSVNPARSLTLP